jgi:hypothetical protein
MCDLGSVRESGPGTDAEREADGSTVEDVVAIETLAWANGVGSTTVCGVTCSDSGWSRRVTGPQILNTAVP